MPLAPPQVARNPNGHTTEEVRATLLGHNGARRWAFRYALLDSRNQYLGDLDGVVKGSCVVSQNWLADIKRTMRLTLQDRGGIEWLTDRIQPWVRLHLPPYGEKDWVEWPQGVFLLTSPRRRLNASGVVTREVQGYDQLQVYSDEKYVTRFSVAAGTVVTDMVKLLLASAVDAPSVRITPHAGKLAATKEWEPGTSKLRIMNDLLSMINYESLSFDEDGFAVVRPYRSPQERGEEYVYADDQDSVIFPDAEHVQDLWGIPNRWAVVVSEPDQPAMIATYVNANPASPTSTVRRRRTITDYRTEWEAVDYPTLVKKVERLAFEASQVYEEVPFTTGLMPIHSGNDVYRVRLDRLAINAKYAEVSWEMTLDSGAPMRHTARRVVTV